MTESEKAKKMFSLIEEKVALKTKTREKLRRKSQSGENAAGRILSYVKECVEKWPEEDDKARKRGLKSGLGAFADVLPDLERIYQS